MRTSVRTYHGKLELSLDEMHYLGMQQQKGNSMNIKFALCDKTVDSIKYIAKFGSIYSSITALALDILKPLFGNVNKIIFYIVCISICIVFIIKLVSYFGKISLLETYMHKIFGDKWFYPVLGMFIGLYIVFGIASFLERDNKNGWLAENSKTVLSIQKSLGLISEDIKDIKYNTSLLSQSNKKIEEHILELRGYAIEMKDRNISNPRMALAERGIEWSPMGLWNCMRMGDVDSVDIFFKIGISPNIKLGMHSHESSEPILFDCVIFKPDNYEKIFYLAIEHGLNLQDKLYEIPYHNNFIIYAESFYDGLQQALSSGNYKPDKFSFVDLCVLYACEVEDIIFDTIVSLGCDINKSLDKIYKIIGDITSITAMNQSYRAYKLLSRLNELRTKYSKK